MGSPASPVSGQPTPPPGYQLDVTPPDGYQVDQVPPLVDPYSQEKPTPPPAALPQTDGKDVPKQQQPIHPVLQQVLDENPGFAKVYNANNTSVVFATGERAKRGAKERGELEFWPPTEEGDEDYPHPSPGKNVLEVYTDELKNNPVVLKNALAGDLTHGMSQDPYWKGLRDDFMQSFTPQEIKRQEQGKTYFEDTNDPKRERGDTNYDAYIMGWFNYDGKQGQKESGNTMYSPKQIKLLEKMQDYLKTGKAEQPPATKKPEPVKK